MVWGRQSRQTTITLHHGMNTDARCQPSMEKLSVTLNHSTWLRLAAAPVAVNCSGLTTWQVYVHAVPHSLGHVSHMMQAASTGIGSHMQPGVP